eukprot:TRINITY_DN2513_c0_g1_i2.p1 TRINITY_DN2513_c0_g1~~TRINITY_DN2513_c0_g1_i2.p1  ORF type:complete len:194 (-),score=63.67 TRINITY_DN2513_c0_g1_i2:319-900(-)
MAEEVFQPKHKKMNADEVASAVSRLYDRPVAAMKKKKEQDEEEINANMKKVHPRPPRRGELSEREQKLVEQLYVMPQKAHQIRQEQLQKKFSPQGAKVVKMSDDQQEELIHRMTVQSQQAHEASVKQVERKIYGAPADPRCLTKEQQQELNDKLYRLAVQRFKEKDEKNEKVGLRGRALLEQQQPARSALLPS